MTPAQTMLEVTIKATEMTAKSYAYGMRECVNDLIQDLAILQRVGTGISQDSKNAILSSLTYVIEAAQKCENMLVDNCLQRTQKSGTVKTLE